MKTFLFTIAAAILGFANTNAENIHNATEVNGGNKVNDTAKVRLATVTGDDAVHIAEDLKIIEATAEPAAPLMPGKSFAEIVADDILVIDGKGNKEISPLDFKKINAVEKKAKKRPINKSGERLVSCL